MEKKKKDLIFNALKDCEIHIQKEGENIQEYHNKYFGVEEKIEIPTLIGGVHFDELLFDENGNVQRKELIYIRTKKMDFTDTGLVGILVHEICHLIKSYNNIKTDEQTVYAYSGLLRVKYEYNNETKRFDEKEKTNLGLEEGLNTYEEEDIMTMITGKAYITRAYKLEGEISRILMENQELKEAIRKAQFDYTDDWKKVLGIEKSDSLIKNLDILVNRYYLSSSEIKLHKAEILEKKDKAIAEVKEILDNLKSKSL